MSATMTKITCPVCGSDSARVARKETAHSFLICNDCGAHYTETHASTAAPQELFDNYGWTQHYSKMYESYLPLIQHSLEQKLRVCEQMTGRRPKTMLDVGCGNGLYTEVGVKMGLSVIGTEVDESSAEVGRRRGLDIRIGKLEDLDIPEKFDFVHIKTVVHLCPEPVIMLRSATEKLAKDGILYVDASHQDGIASRIRRTFSHDPARYGQLIPPRHCVSYTRRAFQTLLTRSNLATGRIFTYSSRDPVYYPVLSGSVKGGLERMVKASCDAAGMGSFLAAYCRAAGNVKSA
jgi:SAM-dependent methyltransferase